jgi:outer membrane biosynthesis protein TonB
MANRDSFDDFDDDDQDDGFMTFDARDEVEDRSRGPLVIAAIVAVLAICGVILWQLYKSQDAGETPQVASDGGSFKTAPADPGGTATDDLDKGVFDAASGGAAPPVQVQPNTTGAEDPLLADGGALPAAVPPAATTPRPAPPPAPVPPPRKEVAATPAPKPAPAVKAPAPKPAPQQVASANPPRTTPAPTPAPVKAATPAPAPTPVAVAQAPAAAPAPKAAAAPTPAPRASSSAIAAQLGSFQTRAAADTALARYRASGLSGPVSVVAADLGAKGTWYRIRATGFDTRSEVDVFCSKARSAGAQCIPTGR